MKTSGQSDPQYQLYLPLKYNDGRPIEEEKFNLTREELVNWFEGLTTTPPGYPLQGYWRSTRGVVKDDIMIWTVQTKVDEDLFFDEYKEKLRQRFVQEVIYLVKIPAEVL